MQLNDFIKRRAALVPAVFSFVLFVTAFSAGISSGVATSFPHTWPEITGAAAAISSEVFGLKGHPYEAYQSVRIALENGGVIATPQNFPQNFRNYALVTAAFKSAEAADISGSPLVSVPQNDSGAILYTQVAFRLFGIDVKSLYYFYFVILGISVAAYLVAFWRDYVACAVLFAAACAIYSFMVGFVFHEDRLMSVASSRFLSTLGIVPLLHIAFLMARGETTLRWPSIGSIIVQASILGLAYVVRSTSLWMVLALLALFAFYLARALPETLRRKTRVFVYSAVRRRGAVVLLALATLVVIHSGRTLLLTPPAKADLYSRGMGRGIHLPRPVP